MSVAERFATRLGSLLERRISRRSALARATLAGSALAVAPVRYLIRPGTAEAVIHPNKCHSGACTDGYTAFCCEIEHGRNTCPTGSYVAGWWKCTDYRGARLCSDEGVRYYLDCNRIPGYAYRKGCHCARGDCGYRRVDCNHFRYGQCNAQVPATTEVVCRLVICQHPATSAELSCNDTPKTDNRTCSHEADCLQGLALQLPGGEGA